VWTLSANQVVVFQSVSQILFDRAIQLDTVFIDFIFRKSDPGLVRCDLNYFALFSQNAHLIFLVFFAAYYAFYLNVLVDKAIQYSILLLFTFSFFYG
jgi:hypothetical protein